MRKAIVLLFVASIVTPAASTAAGILPEGRAEPVWVGPGALEEWALDAAANPAVLPTDRARSRMAIPRGPGSLRPVTPSGLGRSSETAQTIHTRTDVAADVRLVARPGGQPVAYTTEVLEAKRVSNGSLVRDDYRARVVVRRGDTGAAIWSTPAMAPRGDLWTSIRDIDGDGWPEVIAFDVTHAHPDRLGGASEGELTHEITVFRGADGEKMWSRTETSSYAYQWASSIVVVQQVDDLPLYVEPFGDADGDGIGDVLYSTADITGAYVAVSDLPDETDTQYQEVTGTAIVISGATGATVGSFSTPKTDWLPSFTGLADASGDGLADVAAQTATETSAHSADGTLLWRASVEARDWWGFLETENVTGDGIPDVVVFGINYYFSNSAIIIKHDRLATVDAATGSVMIDRTEHGHAEGAFTYAGETDGNGLDFYFIDSVGTPSVSIVALQGSSGSRIWGPVFVTAPPGYARYAFFSGAVDLNGDGAWDALARGAAYDDGYRLVRGRMRAFDGRSGTVLWSIDPYGPADAVPADIRGDAADGGGDVDLDGDSDLATSRNGTTELIDGLSRAPFWSFPGGSARYVSNVQGEAGAEAFVQSAGSSGPLSWTTLSVRAPSGVVWTADPRAGFRV